jgi:hypothetical protein
MSILDLFSKKDPDSTTTMNVLTTLFFNSLNASILQSWESDKRIEPLESKQKLIIMEVREER